MRSVEIGCGTHTENDVIDMLVFGRAFLWANGKSALLCEFEDYPQMRVCRYWIGGGDKHELMAMKEATEAWARANGATRMEIVGRAGWLREMKDYRKVATFMIKDLDNASV